MYSVHEHGPSHWKVRKEHSQFDWCICGTTWCNEHNDCLWECWNIRDNRHMTQDEYNERNSK